MKCVLIGYYGTGDYKLLDRTDGRIFRSRDVIFEEGLPHRTLSHEPPAETVEDSADLFPSDPTPTAPTEIASEHELVPDPLPEPALPQPPAPVQPPAIVEPPTVPRRSARARNPSTAAINAEDTERRIRGPRTMSWTGLGITRARLTLPF